MTRRLLVSTVLGLFAGASLLVLADPAGAAPTVTVTATSVVITQTTDVNLIVTKDSAGDILVQDAGQPTTLYPNRPTIVVTMLDSAVGSNLEVVVDAVLEGGLRVDMPGAHDMKVRGSAAILGSLRVDGDDKVQQVSLGVFGEPVRVDGTVTVNLDDGVDYLNNGAPATVNGNLSVKGVNNLLMDALTVHGSAKISVSNEVEQSQTEFGPSFFGHGFKYTGSNDRDAVDFDPSFGGPGSTTIKGNASFTLKGNTGGFQGVDLSDTFVDGKVTVKGTAGDDQVLTDPATVITGTLSAKLGHGANFLLLAGPLGGSKVDYVGGDGADLVTLAMPAPLALVKVKTGAGDDNLTLPPGTQLAMLKLTADLGVGTDTFEPNGFVLPPGSTVVGLP